MTNVPIELVASANKFCGRACDAMVVYGDDVVDIIETLSLGRYASGTLYALPQSGRDITAAGVVWIGNGQSVPALPGAVPLVKASQALWIPVDADLSPTIAPETLVRIASGDAMLRVWLGDVGLVGFTADDVIDVRDWLLPPDGIIPPGSPRAWHSVAAVPTIPGRMTEVSMASPPGLASMFADVQQELGSPPGSLSDLQDDSIGKRAKDWVLEKLDAMAGPAKKQGGNSQAGNSQVGKPSKVTASMAAMLGKFMQRDRDQQIQKLLSMMDADPDKALQYAIPIGGIADAFRGFSLPGSALMSRLTDFSLGGLFGGAGGAADPWSIDGRLQFQLQHKYRQQANRELAAGRYRRAAYILAHLLSDFRGAAEALEQGKFYGEAAVLYRDKLNNSRSAADCFRRGNMHRDACELYVKIGDLETAGEVMLDAGLDEEARELFSQAVDKHLITGAVLPAAKLMNERLDQRSEAIEMLCQLWPDRNDSHQSDATRGVQLAIDWMGQDGDHERTIAWLSRMRKTSSAGNYDILVAIAAKTATTYPDHRVREAAEDHCRVAVARATRTASPLSRHEMLRTLGGLDRHDGQLHRDAAMFAGRISGDQDLKKSPPTNPKRRQWSTLPAWFLPGEATYVDYRVCEKQILALAVRGDQISLVQSPNPTGRGGLNQTASATLSSGDAALTRQDAMIAQVEIDSPARVHVAAFAPVEHAKQYKRKIGNAVPPCEVSFASSIGIMAAGGDDIRGGANAARIWAVVEEGDQLTLRLHHGQSFDLMRPYLIAIERPVSIDDEHAVTPQAFALTLVDGGPIAAINRHLFQIVDGVVQPLHGCTGMVAELAGSMKHTRRRVAIAHGGGLSVLYLDTQKVVHASTERPFTDCLWTFGAKLVGASDDGLHCYETRMGTLAEIGVQPWPDDQRPVRLLRLEASTIGAAYASGRIRRYRLP